MHTVPFHPHVYFSVLLPIQLSLFQPLQHSSCFLVIAKEKGKLIATNNEGKKIKSDRELPFFAFLGHRYYFG